MALKKRLKQEANIMKRGFQRLPQIVGKKIVEKGKAWWEEGQENARLQRELNIEAKKAEREAYRKAHRKAMIAQAVKRGEARAKQGSSNSFDSVAKILLGDDEKHE